jgi:very-short-patch-repair endonuclease
MTSEDREKQQRHFKYKQAKLLKLAEEYKLRLTDYKTQAEYHIELILKDLGINYEEQRIILMLGKFWIADYYLPDYNLIIELDGNQHYTVHGLMKDADRDSHLIALGFDRILRIPNRSAMELDANTLNLTLEDWGIHLSNDNS